MKNFLVSKQKKKENSKLIYERISKIKFLEAEESFVRREEESAFKSRLDKYLEEMEKEL